MQLWPVECFDERGRQLRGFDTTCRCPFDWQQVSDARRRGRSDLVMATRQTDRSHWPNIRFFRYFILTNRECARDDRSGACVTGVSGEVQILVFHEIPQATKRYTSDAMVLALRYLSTIALLCDFDSRAM
jgi:hypothetical protein